MIERILDKSLLHKHPEADLYIYNYSIKTQIEAHWDATTILCRGLILDGQDNIIARPYPKFFNFEQHKIEDIPNDEFIAFDKADGSLGIVYWIKDKPFVATRGSFSSEQAIKATTMLRETYKGSFNWLKNAELNNTTPLLEIIYPANRIVVDYGKEEMLMLTGLLEKTTGKTILEPWFNPIKEFDLPLCPIYPITSIKEAKLTEEKNREGYVLYYPNQNFRVKVKFEEYCRLHGMLTDVSEKNIWEWLKNGDDFYSMLADVPDEFYNWVMDVKNDLLNKHKEIKDRVNILGNKILLSINTLTNGEVNNVSLFEKRKQFAQAIFNDNEAKKKASMLFLWFDKAEDRLNDLIWKDLKPKNSLPKFKVTSQNDN